MLSRRAFLEAGVATCTVPWLTGADALSTPLATPPGVAPPPLYRVVIDGRFDAGAGFKVGVAAAGSVVRSVHGDITELWYYELAPRWRDVPAPIAGLTGADALFCLERLAWDAGLRVVYRGAHRRLAGGAFEHRLRGSRTALAPAASLASAECDWEERLAALVLACPRETPARVQSKTVTCPTAPPGAVEPLYSWVIAARLPRGSNRAAGGAT